MATTLPTPLLTLSTERGALPANGGRVSALVRLEVGFPPVERDRDPIALALVIDRSGSMGGEPLAFAKRAARQALTVLQPGDAVAVVAFESHVQVVVPTTVVEDDLRPIHDAIETIGPGGSTALHAGWVEGFSQALRVPTAAGMARVVLLSDGCANVGISDAGTVATEVAEAFRNAGVSTSAVGLGRHFDELLMRSVSEAGGGTFSFVESPDQLPELFETELATLSATRGRHVRLAFDGASARFVAASQGGTLDAGQVTLPDLVAGLAREAHVTLEVEPGGVLPPLRLSWHDAYTGARETLHVTLDLPALPASELTRRALDENVAGASRKQTFGERMATIEPLVRQGRFAEADRAIEALRAVVTDWPADAQRSERLSELGRLLTASRRRDMAMSSKLAFAGTYRIASGIEMDATRSLLDQERHHRTAKAAHRDRQRDPGPVSHVDDAARSAPPPARGRPTRSLHRTALQRADGGTSRLEVVIGDVTEQAVDAIVNPSNRGLFGTAGVDGAVHARGGPELTDACRAIGTIKYGTAVVTPGFRLPARQVIHTAAPEWKGGGSGELATLRRAYAACLEVARTVRAQSLAIPAIGTGTHRYPPDEATEVAVATVVEELVQRAGPELVRFVVLEPSLARHYQQALERMVQPASPHPPSPA